MNTTRQMSFIKELFLITEPTFACSSTPSGRNILLVHGPVVMISRLVMNEPPLVLTVTSSPGNISITWWSYFNSPPADTYSF